MRVKTLVTLAVAATLSIGGSVVGATAAFADASGTSSYGCTATSYTPYKAGSGQIYGRGYVSCSGSPNRTVFIEVHRSEGWWHPVIATNSDSSASTIYSISAQGCDDNSGHVYFDEVSMSGGAEINSGNSRTLSTDCPL
jgi:hypothetical protein